MVCEARVMHADGVMEGASEEKSVNACVHDAADE